MCYGNGHSISLHLNQYFTTRKTKLFSVLGRLLFPQHFKHTQHCSERTSVVGHRVWRWCVNKPKHKRWRAMAICGMTDWKNKVKKCSKLSELVSVGRILLTALFYFFMSHVYLSAVMEKTQRCQQKDNWGNIVNFKTSTSHHLRYFNVFSPPAYNPK